MFAVLNTLLLCCYFKDNVLLFTCVYVLKLCFIESIIFVKYFFILLLDVVI